MDMLPALLEKFQHIFPDPYKESFIGKNSEGACNFPKVPCDQFADDTKEGRKHFAYSSVVLHCEQKILKSWSDSQDQFIVLICGHTDEGFNNNPISCLSVLSAFAFEQGNTTCLEEIQRVADGYSDYPSAGVLMNNLGVMFEEKALNIKSDECFTKAKNCFEREGDNLCSAVAMLNLAALHKIFGEYQQAGFLCNKAADLCHDISMRTTKDVNLPERVLRRAADLLEEFENSEKFCKILRIGVSYKICGASEACAVFSTKRLMGIQLKERNGENIKEELTAFNSCLFTLMDKQVPELLNTDFMRTVMMAAKINRDTGHCEEANKLVEKLKAAFSSAHSSKYPLYGLMLFQVGHFKFGSGMINEAKSALKEADKFLVKYFGQNHHVTASCKIVMGSCAQQEGNNKAASKLFKAALTVFRSINHQHYEVAEICLKLADLSVEEGNVQLAKEAVQEAMKIFTRVCGEASFKSATGYIKAEVILQKVDEAQDEAADRLRKAMDIYSSLGLRPDHPIVMFCQQLLGNLLLLSGKSKAAEQCLVDAQKQVPLPDESCRMRSDMHHVFPKVNLPIDLTARYMYSTGQHPYRIAEIVSLVNLVYLKNGSDRQNYLEALASCLNKNEIESLEIWEFAGHNVYIHHRTCGNTPVYLIISLDPEQFTDDGSDSNRVTLSRSRNSSCILSWKSSCGIQEMKESRNLDFAIRESVGTLFLQPKFRKTFEEKRDFYMELAIPAELSDTSSLCIQIEYLPLLIELNLTELPLKIGAFDYLTSWTSSFSSEPQAHVSTFCYKFDNQRRAEFAFDHLICNLTKHLALGKVQVVEVSSEPNCENTALFPLQGDRFSSLSVIVFSDLPVLEVKCRTLKESQSNCICDSVQNSLVKVMQSLCELVRMNFEMFVQLHCEGVGAKSIKESLRNNCNFYVKPSSPSLVSETVEALTFATTGDPEAELEKKPSACILQRQDVEAVRPVDHSGVDICLHLLDYILTARTVLPEEEALNSYAAPLSTISSCDSSIQHHSQSDHSFLSACSASSLNSLPTSPSTFSESSPFEPNKACSSTQPSTRKLKENNLWPLPAQNNAEELTCMKHVSKSSCSGLQVKLPFQSSDRVAWSSSEEFSTTGENIPDLKPNEPEQEECVHELQSQSHKEGCPGSCDHKHGVQGLHATGDLDSKVGLCTESQSTKCLDIHLEPNQRSSSQSHSELLPPTVSEVSGKENLRNECLGDSLPNLEDEIVSTQNQNHEIREQINKLEELFKKSEEEKKQLQAELGRYLFLEDKQRRSGKRQLLSSLASSSDGHRLAAASGSVAISADRKLLGGASPSQEPSFTLQARLLEISNSLTADELKQMKFLSKGKVGGFRLARIREGFELFEELETDGKYPWTFIGQLLEGIRRFDLLEKLGLSLSGTVKSDHPAEAGMMEKTNESPENAGSSPEPLSRIVNWWDMEAERQDKKTNTANQASHVYSKKSNSTHLLRRDDVESKSEKKGLDYSLNGLVSSGGSSDETSSGISALSATASSESSSFQSDLNAREQFPDSSIDSSKLDSSSNTTVSSSNSFARPGQSAQTSSNRTSQDSSDSASRLSSVTSHSAAATAEISSDSGHTTTSSEEEITCMSQLLDNENDASESGDVEGAGACAASSEDRKKGSVNSCDGTVKQNISGTSVLDSEVNSTVDNSAGNHSRPLSGSGARNRPLLQQSSPDVHGQIALSASSSSTTNWERQGARPKQVRMQHQPPESVPQEIISPLSDGLAGDFLARHSQDRALHQSLYRDGADLSLFNDAPLQGASYADGMLNASESSAAKTYFGDCQVASRTYPYRLGSLSRVPASGLLGGCSYNDHLSSNSGLATGPLPSHLAGNTFTFHRNYPLTNSSNIANDHSFQSSFVNSASRFAGTEYFSRQSYLQYDQHSDMGMYQLGPRNQLCSGMAQWNVAEGPAVGAVGFQMAGHSLYSTQRHNVFGETTASITPEQDIRQTSRQANVALPDQSSSFTKSNHVPSASTGNTVDRDIRNYGLPAPAPCSLPSCSGATSGTVSTTTSLPSPVCTNTNALTLGNDDIRCLIASQVAADGDEENSLVPHSGSANADHVSTLNRDFGANSGEGTDNSLVALEQRVAEACALVERVLREREEREQFGREIERKEQMIREQRERERREREEREIQEAERWPQQQEAITARSQWLCEHYQRHCRVRFPCCGQFYPCHRCHNNSRACDNEEAKACHATHLQCNHCQHEQEIDENSGICSKCGGKMSAYFCSICKHFTSVDKNPYHCEKCGICRIHKDKSFHCDTCNVCLDKRLDGNHKCRPDSGHDECCICLEDAFSGCQILPCSHKVHRECAIAMIQNGIRTCPICRHPLYSPSRR